MKIFSLFSTLLFLGIPSVLFAQSGGNCVNGGNNPPPCPSVGSNPINAPRGNLAREQSDLTVYGPASFSFGRIYNSRTSTWTNRSWELGTNNTWQHNWQYEMRESTQTSFGVKQMILRYPEGREYYFSAVDSTGSVRVPQANWGDRLYPTGTNAYLLRTPEGKEYVFSRVGPNSNYQYLLNEVRDGMGYKWTLTYATQSDGKYRLTKIANNFGRYITISREPSTASGYWRITNVAANDGRIATFNYTTWANTAEPVLAGVSYPGGETANYAWAGSTALAAGSPVLASAVDPMHSGSGSRCKYAYNYNASYPDSYGLVKGTILEERNFDTNQLIVSLPNGGNFSPTITEGNGTSVIRKVSLAVGGNDNLLESGDGEGRKTTHTYGSDGAGYRTSTTDNAGAVTTFVPDYAGRVTSSTDTYGKTRSATFSTNGFIMTETDELNRTTSLTRNTNNQISRTDYPDGSFETFTYNTNGQPLTHQLKSGAVETSTYDTAGNLTSYAIAYNNGSGSTLTETTTYTYFSNGLKSSMTDPRGNTINYLYDWRRNITRMTFPGGSYKQMVYDNFGNMTSTTDELGHTWSKAYTEYNEVATTTDPLNRVTSYEYGQEPGCSSCGYRPTITKVTLPSGKKTEYTYDRSGKRTSVKVGAGSVDEAVTMYSYDLVGNMASMIDGRGKITTYGYDLLKRKTSEIDPLSHSTSWEYDDLGNNLRINRDDTTYTEMTYDTMHRVLTTRNPNNETTTYTYFPDGSLSSLQDARTNTYNFTVDGRSRRTRMTYPGSSFENWTYDSAGNMSVYTARNTATRTCTYDARNRETICDWSDATLDVSKTYDDTNRMLTLNNSNSALTYTYDNANQILSETQAIANGPTAVAISYGYDLDGNRNSVTYPGSGTHVYTYTGRNQLASIISGSVPDVIYTYDLAGNRTDKALSNGTSATSTFDDANRITGISQSIGLINGYSYNSINNRTSKTTTLGAGPIQEENYGFDAADQLISASYSTGGSISRNVSYNYDSVGNRTRTTDAGNTVPYTANTLNQYTAIDGLSTPTYDGNGNPTNLQYPGVNGPANGNPYYLSYDSQNRLRFGTNGNPAIVFNYDARNRQASRTINGVTSYYLYDGWTLIAEYSNATTLGTVYLPGGRLDEIIYKDNAAGTARSYYHEDALGSVSALSNGLGVLIESYRYDAYGTPQFYNPSGTNIGGSAYNNRFLFTGREWMAGLNFYDYRKRQYSPQMGRFLQSDPVLFTGNDVNIYRYANNSVTRNFDPFGLSSCTDFSKSIVDAVDKGGRVITAAASLMMLGRQDLTHQGDRGGAPVDGFKSSLTEGGQGSDLWSHLYGHIGTKLVGMDGTSDEQLAKDLREQAKAQKEQDQHPCAKNQKKLDEKNAEVADDVAGRETADILEDFASGKTSASEASSKIEQTLCE